MKLSDIIGLDNVVCVNEVFDTKIPVESWKIVGNTITGDLIIDTEQFNIILEIQTFTFNNNTFDFLNVAFAKIVNGKPTQDLIITSKNSSKLLGAIFNAISDKIKELSAQYDVDAVVLVARDNVDKRMSLYNKIASNMFNPFTVSKTDIPLPNGGKMTALFRKSFDKQTLDMFIKYVNSLGTK